LDERGKRGSFLKFLFLLMSKRGMREIPPSVKRTALKVKGPTKSIPLRCATNANPQIIAVINKSMFDFKLNKNLKIYLL